MLSLKIAESMSSNCVVGPFGTSTSSLVSPARCACDHEARCGVGRAVSAPTWLLHAARSLGPDASMRCRGGSR